MLALDRMAEFNGDGQLDYPGRVLPLRILGSLCRKDSADGSGDPGLSGFADKKNRELFVDDDNIDVFADAGLDYEELEFMDPLRRRVVLEEAGLNPDEFDF